MLEEASDIFVLNFLFGILYFLSFLWFGPKQAACYHIINKSNQRRRWGLMKIKAADLNIADAQLRLRKLKKQVLVVFLVFLAMHELIQITPDLSGRINLFVPVIIFVIAYFLARWLFWLKGAPVMKYARTPKGVRFRI